MRGTPHFVGKRLREAREAREFTATGLADLVGVSKQTISQIENDKQTPSAEVMEKLAGALHFPMAFFLRPVFENEGDTPPLFYRSMSALTKSARIRAERRFGWLRQIVQYASRFVDLPAVAFISLDIEDPRDLSDGQIELIANKVRHSWGLKDGPISNLVGLLENNGAIVARCDLGPPTLDAFSYWDHLDNRPYIVLGTSKPTAARARMDAAHELAHMVLHRRINRKLLTNPSVFKLLESQAFRFAGAFLLPATSFAAEAQFVSLESLKSLKAKWMVAIQTVIMRMSDLGFLSETKEGNLWRNLSRRGWRTNEPLDDVLEIERPRLLKRSFDMLLDNGIDPAANLGLELGIRAEDMEAVCGLSSGYLSVDRVDQVIMFPGASQSASAPSWNDPKPIQFPNEA